MMETNDTTPRLKAAILIVSDTASQEPASDKTANVLAPILAAEGKWETPTIKIVPDNVIQIQQAVCDWTDGPNWHNLVLLSGGTGFAVRDNTPEVRHFAMIVNIAPALMTSLGSFDPDPSPCSGISVSVYHN